MSVTFSHRLEAFGINLVDIPPGEEIPDHDEIERDQPVSVLIASAPGFSGYEPIEWA